jgi:energy-converting hydrogenase Eha subunit A
MHFMTSTHSVLGASSVQIIYYMHTSLFPYQTATRVSWKTRVFMYSSIFALSLETIVQSIVGDWFQLTSWSIAFIEKLPVTQLFKKFKEPLRLITVFTRA